MNKFIGVKIVMAVLMTAGEFNKIKPDGNCKDRNPDDEGYKVEYPQGDGYVSWCPKDVFEANNRPTVGMTFGMAIEAMKEGERVQRVGWNCKGMFLELQSPDENSKMTFPYPYFTIPFCKEGTRRIPYASTIVDIMSEDWQIVE